MRVPALSRRARLRLRRRHPLAPPCSQNAPSNRLNNSLRRTTAAKPPVRARRSRATIERLERELAEQRDAAKTLRESLDAATFQNEILEKSYAKQLAEVRDKRAALEAELQEKDEILAGLGGGHEHTLRELNDALTVIKVLKKERDQLRKQIAKGGSFRQPSETTKARALLGDDAAACPRPGDEPRRHEHTRTTTPAAARSTR